MNVVTVSLGVLAVALVWDAAHAQEKLMNFAGRERPALMMIEPIGLTRYRPDMLNPDALVRTINYIGEGFLDVETALPTPDLAARRPKVTPEILAAMDGWTNEYGRPWTVASYGGPLTPERMLAHTVRFNTGNILYSPYYSKARLKLEAYMLEDKDIAQKYFDANCPTHRRYVKNILNIFDEESYYNSLGIYSSDLDIYKYDERYCHYILHDWLRRNVSDVASFGGAAAVGELFAWYHSPDYTLGDLPEEVEDIIRSHDNDSADYWDTFQYEGKRYEAIRTDLMANLERVNAGRLPDSPEAGVADYGTMLFLIATGRLLPPTATYVAD